MPNMIEAPGRIDLASNITFDKRKRRMILEMRNIARRACNEVIQADNRVPVLDETVAKMGANKSRRSQNDMTQVIPSALYMKCSINDRTDNARATLQRMARPSWIEITLFLLLLAASA